MKKEITVNELLERIEEELKEAKKEAYYFGMIQLFPQFDDNKYINYMAKYKEWQNDYNERVSYLMKERSILRDMIYKWHR